MTNRDPNQTEFTRKFLDYYDCYARYFSIADEENRLVNDLKKSDINLVCFHEKYQMLTYMRENKWVLHKQDFDKLNPTVEALFLEKLNNAYSK